MHKIQIIADGKTNLDKFLGHWGISFLINENLIFDTFGNAKIFTKNLKKLNIDISKIKYCVISHNHWDHISGIEFLKKTNPNIKFFMPDEITDFLEIEKNVFKSETLPLNYKGKKLNEQFLILKNENKINILTGCAHIGIDKIVNYAKEKFPDCEVDLIAGGFHMRDLSLEKIAKICNNLGKVNKIIPVHCTGKLATKYMENFFKKMIETHAHLLSPQFDETPEKLLQDSFNNNIKKIIDVGYDLEYSQKAVEFANNHKNVFASIGVHPHDATSFNNETLELFKTLAKNKKVVAIGEIGLDYYRNLSPQDIQKKVFLEQFELAKELNLPVIIHCRDAHQDLQKLLPTYHGVVHAFSGSINDAKHYIDKGFFLGIGGPITYKNNIKTIELIKNLGISHVVLETDCPYLTPEPHRGKKNKPEYLKFIAEKISQILNITFEEVDNITSQNAKKIFHI